MTDATVRYFIQSGGSQFLITVSLIFFWLDIIINMWCLFNRRRHSTFTFGDSNCALCSLPINWTCIFQTGDVIRALFLVLRFRVTPKRDFWRDDLIVTLIIAIPSPQGRKWMMMTVQTRNPKLQDKFSLNKAIFGHFLRNKSQRTAKLIQRTLTYDCETRNKSFSRCSFELRIDFK